MMLSPCHRSIDHTMRADTSEAKAGKAIPPRWFLLLK
jgi:hypothetical protein